MTNSDQKNLGIKKIIGVKNFRIFKEYTEFEIKPLTLLVGPNNAGKSSFTKLLLLLKNGTDKLDFDKGMHNLESFDKVLNWENIKNNDKLLDVYISSKNLLPFKGFYRFAYKKMIVFENNPQTIETFNFSLDKNLNSFGRKKGMYGNNLVFELKEIIDLIYKKKLMLPFQERIEVLTQLGSVNNHDEKSLMYLPDYITNFVELKNVKIPEDFKKLGFKEINERPKNNFMGQNSMNEIMKHINEFAYAWSDEINDLPRNYCMYDIFENGVNISQVIMEDINILLDLSTDHFSFEFTYKGEMKSQMQYAILTEEEYSLKHRLKQFLEVDLSYKNIEVKENQLYKMLFSQKINDFDSLGAKTLLDKLKENLKPNFAIDFSKLEYLTSKRGNQRRYFSKELDLEIEPIVKRFNELKNTGSGDWVNQKTRQVTLKYDLITRLEDVFKILEIEGQPVIENKENLQFIYLKTANGIVNLADLGYGYGQILPILLKILILESGSTCIIEEPEANLHPNLQSKLAEVFVYFIKEESINLIIETHSEYLIRKLQYLTADNNSELTIDDSVIYYFNADKYVNSQEPKVKRINIKENGSLDDKFGPGFYDETSRLQFDLMILNKEQSN